MLSFDWSMMPSSQSVPDQSFLLARLRGYLAPAQRWVGRYDEAWATATAAAAAHAEDPAAEVEQELGLAAAGLGRYGDALPHLRAALALDEKSLPKDHPNVILARLFLGETMLRAGDRAGARQTLEPAYNSAQTTQLSPFTHADVEFALARALPATEHERSMQLASAARTADRNAPATPRYQKRLAEMDAFAAAARSSGSR